MDCRLVSVWKPYITGTKINILASFVLCGQLAIRGATPAYKGLMLVHCNVMTLKLSHSISPIAKIVIISFHVIFRKPFVLLHDDTWHTGWLPERARLWTYFPSYQLSHRPLHIATRPWMLSGVEGFATSIIGGGESYFYIIFETRAYAWPGKVNQDFCH